MANFLVVIVGGAFGEEAGVIEKLVRKFTDATVPFAEVGSICQESIAVSDLIDGCVDGGCHVSTIFITLPK
jgi:hypothetical protein